MSGADEQSQGFQDVFISHASADKARYINPLTQALVTRGVTFWLDALDIGWGDSITRKINGGLRDSRFVLLCLSQDFLGRRWPEDEMYSTLALQNQTGVKRVLPLILNARDEVLTAYPLLADKAYRTYEDPDSIAADLANLVKGPKATDDMINVVIESVYTGQRSSFRVSPRVSVGWLREKAKKGVNLMDEADVGAFARFTVRWVLVDAKAATEWLRLPRSEKRRVHAVISTEGGFSFSYDETDRISDIGVTSNITFNMCAIEDEDKDPISYDISSI